MPSSKPCSTINLTDSHRRSMSLHLPGDTRTLAKSLAQDHRRHHISWEGQQASCGLGFFHLVTWLEPVCAVNGAVPTAVDDHILLHSQNTG